MMDVVYLGIAAVMGSATYGLVWLCRVLKPGKRGDRP